MKKLHKVVEAVVEKTVGRILPKTKAQAGCHSYESCGCCGPTNNNWYYQAICNGQVVHFCDGLCPQ